MRREVLILGGIWIACIPYAKSPEAFAPGLPDFAESDLCDRKLECAGIEAPMEAMRYRKQQDSVLIYVLKKRRLGQCRIAAVSLGRRVGSESQLDTSGSGARRTGTRTDGDAGGDILTVEEIGDGEFELGAFVQPVVHRDIEQEEGIDGTVAAIGARLEPSG